MTDSKTPQRPVLEILDGGRAQLEVALVEDLFLGRLDAANEKEARLKRRGRLSLATSDSPVPDATPAPHRST